MLNSRPPLVVLEELEGSSPLECENVCKVCETCSSSKFDSRSNITITVDTVSVLWRGSHWTHYTLCRWGHLRVGAWRWFHVNLA